MTKAEIKAELERLLDAEKATRAAVQANKTPETMTAHVEASKARSDFMVEHDLGRKPRGRYACRAGQRQAAERAAIAAEKARLKRKW
jgi:hypothetical protein